jgi:hypothetical protein
MKTIIYKQQLNFDKNIAETKNEKEIKEILKDKFKNHTISTFKQISINDNYIYYLIDIKENKPIKVNYL